MKKSLKTIALVLAAVMLTAALTACFGGEKETASADDEEQIRALISECEKACRALDLEGVLKTLDPKVQKTVKKLAGLAEKITGSAGLSFETLAGAMSDGGTDVSGEDINETLSGLSVEVTRVELDGAKAVAYAEASFNAGGSDISKEIGIKCKKSGGKWYIAGIKMPKEEN